MPLPIDPEKDWTVGFLFNGGGRLDLTYLSKEQGEFLHGHLDKSTFRHNPPSPKTSTTNQQ